MDEEGQRRTIHQLLDLFIEPEIERRQETDEIETPYPLKMAQVIFYPDGTPPRVRLNDEVRTILKVKLKEGLNDQMAEGDAVYWDQIDSVESSKLTDEDDPNAGHATLLYMNGTWLLHFDFVYNKERSLKHIEAARQFLTAAEEAFEREHWAVFVDSLCSASELGAKAYLLSSPDPALLKSKSHGAVASRANRHAKLGNLDKDHVAAFNRTWGLRNRARYLEGELDMSVEDARKLVTNLSNFISYVEERITMHL